MRCPEVPGQHAPRRDTTGYEKITMKFTDAEIRNLKPQAERYYVRADGPRGSGTLALRVSPNGHKAWEYEFRHGGKKRRMTLGSYPEMTVAGAHAAHGAAMLKLERGKDPAVKPTPKAAPTPQSEARASPATFTVKKLCTAYMNLHAAKKKSGAEDLRMISVEILPAFGNRSASAITRVEIIALLAKKALTAPISANRLKSLIHMIYEFGVYEGLLKVNPCLGLKMPAKEHPRDRVLSASEIQQFWGRLETAPIAPATRHALKLLLITGQRTDMVRTMQWSEVNIADRLWTVPASKMKNDTVHRVHLSPMALDVLAAMSNTGVHVFPGDKAGKPFTETVTSTAVRRNLAHFGVGQWTPHDLRRTVASQMAELRVLPVAIECVLAHLDRTVAGTYNRYNYDREKREALDAWSARLTEIVGTTSLSGVNTARTVNSNDHSAHIAKS
ncbi:MAG: site-specific integrase [Myxococcales bacterium]|nr:site-specific integrase [Myxococcales bacterium]